MEYMYFEYLDTTHLANMYVYILNVYHTKSHSVHAVKQCTFEYMYDVFVSQDQTKY